ncbi:protein-L-isoaspartate(D-aspartate) O-methyltransferase [Geomonas sp. Red69]|uniref:protein-L-isoaspartate(D-aspartate) O-methyltransferase n=1 Tax=Geomonas diazotrophica TaxID=2843197 RepID=UPI001C101FCC|nr:MULTISPECIES: protein-L-isoaspartate(D-aspartate) O-methyltransferase [Geomonas]MBU5638801.1 protein-L-isoaspartate(D-aspartate) O-methyltransferase [Geomonas diazotrophica]QXE85699.1 protein-L-isoaspartate(D-aspartate) O-methyltransferase [Geomonas nitrogeniifigens]
MSSNAKRELEARKEQMLSLHLVGRGIRDAAVLRAMREVPRESFLPAGLELLAYEDGPLPIQEGQTISQPYIVAYMIEALELQGTEKVLEIGTGSGYAAAVLSLCAAQVFTVERLPSLAHLAAERLRELGYGNVAVRLGDGTLGWQEHAPYDAIVVTAGAPGVPEELELQLAPGGRLVIPVGPTPHLQDLVRVRRDKEGALHREALCGVRFVPLIGAQGWED